MKKLFLIRHAKSSWDSSASSDFDRPLNDQGKTDVPGMAEFLCEQGIVPDQFFTSSAVRAYGTAKLIAKGINFEMDQILSDRRLYLADVNHLQSMMRGFSDDWNCVFLLGHNPTITECANLLTNDHLENIPTCGIYGIELHIDSWLKLRNGIGSKLFFQSPKML